MLSLSACERVDDASRSMSSNMQRYDPCVHVAIWHNSNPFVLEEYRKRLKNCRGCNSKFATPKFVISHEERNKRGRVRKAFYHCSHSCIRPRHPYFKSRAVAANPKLAMKLNMDDVRLLKLCEIDLSFVAIVDAQ